MEVKYNSKRLLEAFNMTHEFMVNRNKFFVMNFYMLKERGTPSPKKKYLGGRNNKFLYFYF